MIHAITAKDKRIASLFRVAAGLCMVGLAMASGVGAAALVAQNQDAPGGPIATLRLQTNLIQIPVLVLTRERVKLHSPVPAGRFAISLGGGPWVRPKYVRREGEDPVDLAIVIDPRAPQLNLLPKLSQSVAELASSSLSARDRVSIYVMGCSAMHAWEDLPADSGGLHSAVDDALRTWKDRAVEGGKSSCKPDTHLWDVLAYVTQEMSTKAGRRTILAITNGDDQKSRYTPDDLTALAQSRGVTLFALDPTPHLSGNLGLRSAGEGLLSSVSQLSGGMTLELEEQSLGRELKSFVQMLRDRYIVEFPRPVDAKPGRIDFAVKIAGSDFFIRAAGNGVPLPNPGEIGDGTISVAKVDDQSAVGVNPSQGLAAVSSEADHSVLAPQTVAPVVSEQPSATADTTPPPVTLRVLTKLTVEDVTVTDAKRIPVHGLMKPDFELKEDGKPQIIRNFEEYGVERSSTQPPPSLALNTYTNVLSTGPTTGAVNVLLLDGVTTGLTKALTISPEDFQYARQQSMKYLANLPAGTQVAILHLGSNLRVLQEPTSDKALLLGSMNAIVYKPAAGAYVTRSSPGAACIAANVQSEMIVDALNQIAAYLSGIKGRKNLIWFTPGIPWLTQYQDFSRISCLRDYTAQLHKTYGLLNAARVALYPIDPRGLFNDPSVSASALPQIVAGGSSPMPQIAAPSIQQIAAFGSGIQGEHNSLREMADATGGTPYFNRNDLQSAVGEAIATGSDYYSLSYVPPVSGYDGRFHAISVKVDRPNLLLQYRAGYTSLDPAKIPASSSAGASMTGESMPSTFRLAMGHGTVNSTQLLFNVRVTPSSVSGKIGDPVIGSLSPSLQGKHLVRYDFQYSLSGDQITLVDSSDGTSRGSVELVLSAYDSDGKLLNGLSQTVNFTVNPDDVARFLQRPFQVPIQFDLPPGNIFVRVGVRDVQSGRYGTLEIAENEAGK
jgi:VWFA-related protein